MKKKGMAVLATAMIMAACTLTGCGKEDKLVVGMAMNTEIDLSLIHI